MSDKLFIRRRILAFLMVFLLVFSAIILLPAFSVDAETEEEYAVASSGEISNEVALASGLSNIPTQYLNKCIELTDSDEFEYTWNGKHSCSIEDYSYIYNELYATVGNGPYVLNRDYSYSLADRNYDDPIGEIVPIELMQKIGVYTYFGKEYGFFINTYESPHSDDKNIHSLVFVFNITYSMRRGQDGNPDGCVTVNIEPVFQYRYVYLDSKNSIFKMYDYYDPDDYKFVSYSISNNVIRPHPKYSNGNRSFEYEDIFYIKDISVGMSLYNEQALNYNDNEFVQANDKGAYFIMTENEYSGRILKEGQLTSEDKADIASYVISRVLDVVAFGANIIAPGSGTLIKLLDLANCGIALTEGAFLGAGIQEASNTQIDFEGKRATFMSLYANKEEQIRNYGCIVKSVLVTNNSDNNNSIWYGQGDSYKAYFGINADISSGEQFPNTRAIVECALKIVDKKGNVYGAQNAVSKTVDNKVYQDEAKLGIKKDLYFLENGYNYFVFLPNFSGNYKFNVNLENEVDIKVDGATSADNTFHIEKRDAANPVKVQIDNIGDFARGELFIDALPMSKSFELSAGAENIVRADVESSGYYNLSARLSENTYSNAIFMSKLIPNDRFGIYEDLSRTNKEMTHLNSDTYLVVRNPSRNTETLYIDYEDVEDINEAESVDCRLTSKVPQYIKFVTDDNMDYNISYLNSSFVSVSVYDLRGNEIAKTTVSGETYNNTIFNSADLGEVYIKLVYLGNDKVDFNFIVFNTRSEIKWLIDDKEVPSRRIELERGKTVKISVKINDTEVSGITEHNNESEITFSNNLITIAKTAPLGKITYTFELMNNSSFALTVVPIFEKTISLSLDSAWNLNYSGGNRIESFEYYVKIVDYEEERISSKMSSGKCDFRNQLLSTHNFNPKINIKSIIEGLIIKVPINGWQDSYVDVYVYITNIQVVLDDDGSFDTFGTSYESKSYCMSYYDFFAGGDGTQNNPYKISTTMEFNSLKMLNRDIIDDSYFKQTANLSFGNVLPNTSNMSFRGMYDGGGYTIKYSYVFPAANFKSYIGGMFLENYGTISNLTVNAAINNFSVWNKDDMYGLGGIVGTNYGTISKVNADVNISSCFYFTGGITAVNEGTIESCKVTGKIDLKCEGDFIIGGMIAGSTFGKISSCSSASSTISYVGSESKSRTLAPRMGTIVGIWGGGTLLPTGYGAVNKGTLKTVTWWEGLKKKSHNQAQYVGNIYGQKTF